MWVSGLRRVPEKSRVLTHTTALHSPELIGSRCSQMFSWLPPGKKKKKKRDTKTVSEIARRVGWGEEAGVCDCGVGRSEKKGRMLRTVGEEVRGISSWSYGVSGTELRTGLQVFLGRSQVASLLWCQNPLANFRAVLKLCLSKAAQAARLREHLERCRNTALCYSLMPFPWSQTATAGTPRTIFAGKHTAHPRHEVRAHAHTLTHRTKLEAKSLQILNKILYFL